MQGRKGKTRRMHALLKRKGPGAGLLQARRPVQELHAGIRIQGLEDAYKARALYEGGRWDGYVPTQCTKQSHDEKNGSK